MKKSIAVVLLGSALMLPNNNSAEASYANNEVQTLKAKNVQCLTWEGQQNLTGTYELRGFLNSYLQDLIKQNGQDTTPVQPVVKPSPTTPAKPEIKPTPTAPAKPVEKPAPTVPVKPVEKPAPTVPVKPVEKPTPTEPVQKPVEKPTNASVSAIEQQVLTLTNAERQKAGLQPLQIDSKLQNSARQKSADMASKNYFSHTSPTYGSPFDQMKTNGITYRSAAENIAMGQRSAEEVVKAWMDSPGHKQNILTPGFTHIGIGYDQNGNYWTQQFIQK